MPNEFAPLLADIEKPLLAGVFARPGRYQMCSYCVMDTTDPDIEFTPTGCSNCERARAKGEALQRVGRIRLPRSVEAMRKRGSRREFDAVLGVSGGIDSSACMEWAAESGLRPLIVHVDAGWNTSAAVANIERLCRAFNFELETVVVDWEQLRELHVAFLRAGVANQDIPQDHVLFAGLYAVARANGIRDIIEGQNWQSESILPPGWGHSARDGVHLRGIADSYGQVDLSRIPISSDWQQQVVDPWFRMTRIHTPLHYLDYQKSEAKARLSSRYGWTDYGGKHHESRWTRFFQNYVLPYRFGFDKRKAHLSSLICSGQMTRSDALREMEAPLYDPVALVDDMDYVTRKLGLEPEQFKELLHGPIRRHTDLPHSKSGVKWRTFRRNAVGLAMKALSN